MERRSEEMTSLFDQLRELHDDLTLLDDQVDVVGRHLQQCQQHRRRRGSLVRSSAKTFQHCCLTESEMADIVHRLLTRICELSLSRQEGRNEVPFIV